MEPNWLLPLGEVAKKSKAALLIVSGTQNNFDLQCEAGESKVHTDGFNQITALLFLPRL